MSEKKENVKFQERILAFKLSKELNPEETGLVAGAGGWCKEFTHKWAKGWTRPGEEPDQNEYVVDYEH